MFELTRGCPGMPQRKTMIVTTNDTEAIPCTIRVIPTIRDGLERAKARIDMADGE